MFFFKTDRPKGKKNINMNKSACFTENVWLALNMVGFIENSTNVTTIIEIRTKNKPIQNFSTIR
jgi:hypothetical protein